MTKTKFLTFIFLLGTIVTFSQNIEFSTALIPKELLKDANSVVRFDNMLVEIKSQRSMTVKIEIAITVLNKLANKYSDLSMYYDNSRKLGKISGYVYDEFGNEIKKIKKSDFDDYSAYDGFSLYSEGRYLRYKYTPTTYPYTIHYSYQFETTNTAFIPSWTHLASYYKSIEKSVFTINYPIELGFKKSEKNFKGFNVEIEERPGLISYTSSNVKAIKKEPYAPSMIDLVPNARFGLNKFNLKGIDGEASNWKEFGKWRYDNLNNGNGTIDQSVVTEIRNLVNGVNDPIEKAKIIYNYVQNKVRYISVQEGIGGWRPIPANEVHENSYGDCKGLSNYTKTLLDAVGVESYYTVLWAGNNKKSVDDEIFSMQGNHVILNLPTKEGDLWLECTSQNTPFADGGDFTDDRNALVITPEGGFIKRTRIYDDKENRQNIIGNFKLDNDGNILGEIEMVSSGTQFDNHLYYEGKNNKELDKLYKEFWDNINNMTIAEIGVTNNKKEGKFEEEINFSASNYGVISGERMIFCVNAFNVFQKAPKRIRNRKLPVEVVRGFYDVDEVEIELPSNYDIEAISNDVNIDTEYGSYTMTIEKISDKKLKFKREFLLKTGKYPKEAYTNYRDFWRQVVKSDNSKVVLIKK